MKGIFGCGDRSRSLPPFAVAAVCICALIVGPGIAQASDYSRSAPRFDSVMMLRVAMAYNLSKNAVDLSFPAKSRDACQIAGVGAQTFVFKDHATWTNSGDADAFYESLQASPTGPFRACTWLASDPAEAAVPGLSRVWGATLKPNFKRLRKGLRMAKCKTVNQSLSRYPDADLPAATLKHKITTVMTRPCRADHR